MQGAGIMKKLNKYVGLAFTFSEAAVVSEVDLLQAVMENSMEKANARQLL